MEYHTSELKAGAFITGAVALLIVGIIKVGGLWDMLTKDHQYYATHFKDVQLLKEGAPVTLAGRRIGQVATVRQGATEDRKYQVQVVVKLEAGVIVDSEARLVVTKYGLLDEPHLALKPGNGKRIEGSPDPESAVPMSDGNTPGGMQELMDTGSELLGKLTKSWDESVDPALKAVKEAVASDDATKNLLTKAGKLLDDADAAVNEAKALVSENRPNLKKITDELAARIDTIADELEQLLKDADVAVKDADAVMLSANRILNENDRNIYETIVNLKETMYHMKQFAKKVEADPSTLLFGTKAVEESRAVRDETAWREQGRSGPYLQEIRAESKDKRAWER